MIKINVPNKKKFENALKKHGKEVEVEVAKIVEITAKQAEGTARSKAPVDNGTLRQSIKAEPITDLTWKVTAYAPYAAYQEFGTRGRVSVPSEWINKALPFKATPLIKETNITPKPFMYPSFVEARRNFNRDLKNLFKDLAKKFNNG